MIKMYCEAQTVEPMMDEKFMSDVSRENECCDRESEPLATFLSMFEAIDTVKE
jgi:hypothetical protein